MGQKHHQASCAPRSMALHLLLAAKLSVVRKWKSTYMQSMEELTHDLSSIPDGKMDGGQKWYFPQTPKIVVNMVTTPQL